MTQYALIYKELPSQAKELVDSINSLTKDGFVVDTFQTLRSGMTIIATVLMVKFEEEAPDEAV